MKSIYKKTYILPFYFSLFAFVILVFSTPINAHSATPLSGLFENAPTEYVPLATIPGTVNPVTGKTDLSTYMTGIFKFGVAAAGVLAFLTIVWGGFTYLSTDSITGKEEGKHYVERALGGLILALVSYIILNTINPKLVDLDLYFGRPANQAKMNRLEKPDDVTYSKQLDNLLADLNAENARPEVKDAKIAKGMAIDAAVQIRDIDNQLKALDPLSPEAVALKSERDALNVARGTLLVKASEADVVAANARINLDKTNAIKNLDSSRDVLEIVDHLYRNSSRDIAEMNNLGLPAQADKIKAVLAQARTDIVQADINRGNGNVARGVIDRAYLEQQAAIRAALGDATKTSAAIRKATDIITSVQKQCTDAKNSKGEAVLLTCRNYDPATNPANKR